VQEILIREGDQGRKLNPKVPTSADTPDKFSISIFGGDFLDALQLTLRSMRLMKRKMKEFLHDDQFRGFADDKIYG